MKRQLNWLPIVIAAFGLMRVTYTAGSEPTGGPPSLPNPVVKAPTCGPEPTPDGPWKAAERVFQQDSGGKSCASWKCVPAAGISILVATVADPDATHLELVFDRTVESVMWAVEDTGYSFEHYWLPWNAAPEKKFALFGDQVCQKQEFERRRGLPGLLIFRSKTIPSDFLFVWLVGETPTSGLKRAAFAQALEYSRTIAPLLTSYRVLAPNFSGSFSSLLDILKAERTRHPDNSFQIVSGSATNFSAVTDFKKSIEENDRHYGTFESTVENDRQAARLFFSYLKTQFEWSFLRRITSSEIAILSEDETVYGQLDLNLDTDVYPTQQDSQHDWLMLRYPREIARLRNAYPDDSTEHPGTPQQPTGPGIALTLKDSNADADRQTDSVGTYSTQQSPASQQAVLLTIASTLHRERASYTGLIATDILDSLFLTRFIRDSVPDTRIFTFDSDLLFLRDSSREPLPGILAVTNYPLFSRNQHWTRTQLKGVMPRRVQFASRNAEGTYNACRRLLLPEWVRAGHKVPEEAYLEYVRPADNSREMPPLWLAVTGRDGYWPVALLDENPNIRGESSLTDFSTAQTGSGKSEKFHPEDPSRGWRLLFALACGFCILHIAYVGYMRYGYHSHTAGTQDDARALSRGSRRLIYGLRRIFSSYPANHEPTDEERPFLLTATLAMTSSLAVFSLPLLPFVSHGQFGFYFTIAALTLVLLLGLAVDLSRGKNVYARIPIIAWPLTLVFIFGWIFLAMRTDYRSGEFFAYRSLYLGNGVSPGVPIILLASTLYGWAWVQLNREDQVQMRRKARPDSGQQPWPDQYHQLLKSVDHVIEDVMSAKLWVPALSFLVLWFVVLWPPGSLRSFEYWFYDITYGLILTAVYWCVFLVLTQFVRCWRQLRRVLEEIERSPIRHAFSRLNKEISWLPLVSAVPSRSLAVTTRSVDCLKALKSYLERTGRDKPLEQELKSIAHEVLESMKVVSTGIQIDDQQYERLQGHLDEATKSVLKSLYACPWQEGYSESVVNELERIQKQDPLTDLDKIHMLEEEFIALRMLMHLRYVIRHLRNFLGFVIAAFIISTISMNAYPFLARRWIGLASVFTFLAIGSAVALVFAEMDRDPVLSRITDTKANEVGRTFFFRLTRFGALPLLTLVATQFPSVSRWLFSWAQPALEALK